MAKYKNPKELLQAVSKVAGTPRFVLAFAPSAVKRTVYWSDYARSDCEPHDALVNCLQALHEGRGGPWGDGIAVLRGDSTPLSIMAKGMMDFLGFASTQAIDRAFNDQIDAELIKCDKRTQDLPGFDPNKLGPAPNVNLAIETKNSDRVHVVHRLYMMLAFALVQSRIARTLGVDTGAGHNIGAVLVASDGRLLGWGLNTVKKNYTYHAELNAIQEYYGRTREPLPEGCRIYTTLKPCLMCAGMIRDAARKPESLRVFFAQDDTSTGTTALDWQAGVQTILGAYDHFRKGKVAISEAKPLRLEHGNDDSDAAHQLTSGYKNSIKSTRGRLTVYLNDGSEAKTVIKSASNRLLEKYKKYATHPGHNLAVQKVLTHIRPFVQAMGILPSGPAQANSGEIKLIEDDMSAEDVAICEEIEREAMQQNKKLKVNPTYNPKDEQ